MVPGGSGGFRVVPAGSGRFRVGSAFYIHPYFGDVGFWEWRRKWVPEEKPKARINNKLNPHMAPGRIRTKATLELGELSQQCAISVSQKNPSPLAVQSCSSYVIAVAFCDLFVPRIFLMLKFIFRYSYL